MPKSLFGGHLRVWFKWVIFSLLSAAFIIVGQGCDGPPLKPWHTETLTAEFAADRADEIRTFADYRQLEDELFQELDEKVYARVETGPEYALARYSPGSAADPRGRSPDWNRSFELPVDEICRAPCTSSAGCWIGSRSSHTRWCRRATILTAGGRMSQPCVC